MISYSPRLNSARVRRMSLLARASFARDLLVVIDSFPQRPYHRIATDFGLTIHELQSLVAPARRVVRRRVVA